MYQIHTFVSSGYNKSMPRPRPNQRFFVSLGLFLWFCTAIFAAAPIWPHVYYRLTPKTSQVLAQTIANTTSQKPIVQPTPSQTPVKPNLPDFDPSLPDENGLIIDTIGVRGEINEGENWEEILKKGLWRVPEFGTPVDTSKPIIIAAHRWGYLQWSNAFRRLNSFYNLPKLVKGDKINIIWEQRSYEYEIYEAKTGTSIDDYSADLIIYTCEMWNSPTRIFRYAKRVN